MPKVMINMEMPKSCGECRFYFDDNRMGVNYCALTAEETYYHAERPSWCPLQEVKE